MGELRTDPLTGRSVYLAENRAGRPNDFARDAAAAPPADSPRADCPFCPGNERETPEPTLELLDGEGRWRVRCVPNKYPFVDAATGQGVHEVIIESPRHLDRTGRLSVDELTAVLTAYATRLAALAADGRFPYRLLFKNVGPLAGASLSHLHSQLVALPGAPPSVVEGLRRFAAARGQLGRCPWCERIERERADGSRVVLARDGWIAICPHASRQPFETTLLPVSHSPLFERLAEAPDETRSLARFLRDVIRAIESRIGAAGYNLIVQTAPAPADDWHWRIEIVPRVGAIAGFELAAEQFINTVSPEHAAERLRSSLAE